MSVKHGFLKNILGFSRPVSGFFDIVFIPLTLFAAIWFRIVRYWGVKNLPITKSLFLKLGMYPIVDHYYDPLFDFRKVRSTKYGTHLSLNAQSQLKFVKQFKYGEELRSIPKVLTSETEYYYTNGSFGSGDAELYYSIIRNEKPKQILEVGSGFSTRIALKAIQKNRNENPNYSCTITCIEPYEMPWLEKMEVNLIRKKVEDMDQKIFEELSAGDILFIDSSHIIRPGGDVLFLILQILPTLKAGVLIHFHDIFTPTDYPVAWLRDEFRMWNEQYMLEAFLLGNLEFEIIVALNFLSKLYREELAISFPILASEADRDPGSFWIRKIN